MEGPILPAGGENKGVFDKAFLCSRIPAAARERPIDPFVVQLGPEKFLELVFALKILQNAKDCPCGLRRLADGLPPRINCE
jgi:hypothetical protein